MERYVCVPRRGMDRIHPAQVAAGAGRTAARYTVQARAVATPVRAAIGPVRIHIQ